ncbi:MAG TPA: Gfo/Idh/MocA family oxidoreductase [Gemmatales bacterium]|nr:Gfo/Idh/MocA family oxidoreductase [Gemmatales bacterium]
MPSRPNRRDALKAGAALAAVSPLPGLANPAVHPGHDSTIRVALIGCGGRGTGAAADALNSKQGPVECVAMADVFPGRLAQSHKTLSNDFKERFNVPTERQFVGFDAYRHAIDCLRPGDVAILATPPAFRWPHFQYAIEKNVHVFMEKPVTVDGPTSRRMLKLGEESVAKNLKVGVGLMCRHCVARRELFDRIRDGQIGDIVLLRAYRQLGPTAHAFAKRKPEGMSELLYQIREFHAFLWASGGAFSDFLIHNIDECCWMKDAWPIHAKGAGGRHYRGDYVDQNFDTYSVEYTFADGAKLFLEGRTMVGCHQEFASYAHGSKGSAVISASGHSPARCRIHKGQNLANSADRVWAYREREPSPYQVEWDHLLEAIRQDKPFNEVKRGVEASLVTSMGRLAAHTGQLVTFDAMLNHEHELAPDVDKLTQDAPAPVLARADGAYPVPQPGILRTREYQA